MHFRGEGGEELKEPDSYMEWPSKRCVKVLCHNERLHYKNMES